MCKFLLLVDDIYEAYLMIDSMETILSLLDDEDAYDCILKGHLLQSRVYKVDKLIDTIETLWKALGRRTAIDVYDTSVLITNSDIEELVSDAVPAMHIKVDEGDDNPSVAPEIFMAVQDCMETPDNQVSVPLNPVQIKRLVALISEYTI